MSIHINQIKDIVRILEGSGTSNKEEQSCILGYIVGLEAPINLDQSNPDDNVEWNSFIDDISGTINEHFLLNTALAQDVANLTLQYRQAVMNASDKLEETAERFLKLTGSAFGMLGEKGTIRQIRKVIFNHAVELRQGIEERREEREEARD